MYEIMEKKIFTNKRKVNVMSHDEFWLNIFSLKKLRSQNLLTSSLFSSFIRRDSQFFNYF